MLIIPLPFDFPNHKSLGVNTEAWASFAIRPIDDRFQLILFKVIQHDFENDKNFEKWHPIAFFSTSEQCEHLFQAIASAMENGDRVFRVKEYLEANALQRDDLPKV